MAELNIGDRVRLTDEVPAEILIGAKGTVMSVFAEDSSQPIYTVELDDGDTVSYYPSRFELISFVESLESIERDSSVLDWLEART